MTAVYTEEVKKHVVTQVKIIRTRSPPPLPACHRVARDVWAKKRKGKLADRQTEGETEKFE